MLLYIFKNNRIVFNKEDFKDHYEHEMREEGKSNILITDNNLEEVKLAIIEETKNNSNNTFHLLYS